MRLLYNGKLENVKEIKVIDICDYYIEFYTENHIYRFNLYLNKKYSEVIILDFIYDVLELYNIDYIKIPFRTKLFGIY